MTAINSSTLTQSEISRFMSFVRKDEQTGAWLWVGGITGAGYGAFWLRGRTLCAHRLAWIIHRGDIPEGLNVCHKYEALGRHNVNPDHMFLGTLTDNMQDAARKGRTLAGTKNPMAVLTDEQVLEIYNASGNVQDIGERYGISGVAVSKIKRGQMWSSVTGAQLATIHNLKNKSGYPGVRHKSGGWEAQLGWKENGKYRSKYIGRYRTAEAAHEAYLEAKKELHARRASLTPPLPPAP